MWTANPPVVFRRRGQRLHLKCLAFWCCISTTAVVNIAIDSQEGARHTFLILELPLTVPAPRAEDLGMLKDKHECPVKPRTCLFFFFAIVTAKRRRSRGERGEGVTSTPRTRRWTVLLGASGRGKVCLEASIETELRSHTSHSGSGARCNKRRLEYTWSGAGKPWSSVRGDDEAPPGRRRRAPR